MVRKSRNTRSVSGYQTEVYGNVVRKRVQEPERREKESQEFQVSHRRHQQKSANLSIPYCMFVAAACVLTLVSGAYYLQQQALSTSNLKKISSLETELADLRKTNADDLNRIEASVNLDEIREVAINELGMVYASKENVVLYENTSQNYVSQYEAVPEEEDTLIKSVIKSK